jgi:hypothetical protein
MSRARRGLARRDQDASAFTATLSALCDAAGILGAALVDGEGETVDYAGDVDPYEIKVMAAEFRVLLATIRAVRTFDWCNVREIVVRSAKKSFVVAGLDNDYDLVLALPRYAFGVSQRALAQSARELCQEAGLTATRINPKVKERWVRVDVLTTDEDPRRPHSVLYGGYWQPIVILGRYNQAQLARGEIGYRARIPTGGELTLVREPLGHWYMDWA